jgi:hypothetical protein
MSDDVKARVALARALLHPCLMCGARPDMAALFIPFTPGEWGGRPDKTRLVAYSLCDRCKAEKSPQACEDELARRMGVAA